MDKEEVTGIAQTIAEQLIGTTDRDVLFSWGIQRCNATLYKGMAALQIKVGARLFSDDVMVCYNGGTDYYEVYLKERNGENCISPEACFDELGGIIDRAIESGTNKAEYEEFCEGEWQKMLRGDNPSW